MQFGDIVMTTSARYDEDNSLIDIFVMQFCMFTDPD